MINSIEQDQNYTEYFIKEQFSLLESPRILLSRNAGILASSETQGQSVR